MPRSQPGVIQNYRRIASSEENANEDSNKIHVIVYLAP